MNSQMILLLFLLPCIVVSSQDTKLVPPRWDVYDNGKIYDITHRITAETPTGISQTGIGEDYLRLHDSMKNGSDYNFSIIKLPAHSGTHVDAPGHFYENYYEEGFDVDSLDLRVLNGPALLVDVPRDTNITAKVMKSLNIPKGVRRVLFRTLNTDRRLMWEKRFDTSYVGFMKDGAQWLKDNTDIKLVGIDYLSVAAYDHLVSAHRVFLKNREIILVEGLKLKDLEAGIYDVHCLPLRLFGAEGSPIRCLAPDYNLGKLLHGCEHYKRRCKLRAPCCNKLFSCRHCHNKYTHASNDPIESHKMVLKDVKQVVCLICNTEQPVSHICANCGVKMGEYFCAICNLYDDDTSKQQFHCYDCGICRLNGRDNYYHCQKCGCCLSIELRGRHVCSENAIKKECPVCLEHLFHSIKPMTNMHCGHAVHLGCYFEMMSKNQPLCPGCSKFSFVKQVLEVIFIVLFLVMAATY
ncbi:hypothetical protein E3N88_27151 [Mikania micrantha]|uniref:CHY-type domain-containing protein n=1 Tax=Mikania micrantha TaxID=192012 RepID=A0A5N6MX13_9ASTR|nr:hypothetical protein E3N88_27151 [Mikania micrantha]